MRIRGKMLRRIRFDRIEILLEDFGRMEIVCIDPLIVGCGISQPMYQVLSFTTCILMIPDLFNLIFLFIILKGRTRSCRFSCREQFWVVRYGGFEETCMERRVNLVIQRELELVRGRFKVSSNDFEGSDITIEELCTFSLSLDVDT